MSFKQSDIVELVSGGPPMTVKVPADKTPNQNVTCLWFTEGGERREDLFPLAMLKASKPKD